jgi:hypothetical protein
MPFKKFSSKKREIPRKDYFWNQPGKEPLEKPDPAKKKATKLRRIPTSGR